MRSASLMLALLAFSCSPVPTLEGAPGEASCLPATVTEPGGARLGFCDSPAARASLEARLGASFSPQAPNGGHWHLSPDGRLLRDHHRAEGWVWFLLRRQLPLEDLRWQDLEQLPGLGLKSASRLMEALGQDRTAVLCGWRKAKGLGKVRLALLRRWFATDCEER